ncbi:uncharacterized protein LOC135940808 [Cloeon dipterum]|uniref:uncharacterized protein LOC135940808 n=1 Tax=Cloeon dipterum TaxID=197152 RepID=UPI00321F88E7
MNLVQKLLQDFGADSAVLTIGSNEGNMSCQNYELSFAWCNQKREIVLPAIMQEMNSLEIVQKGLTACMLNGAAVLKTSDSNSLFPFLCEPKDDFQDSCLALKCNKDSTLFDANGNIKDGEKYGKWTRTCDKSYLFTNKLQLDQSELDAKLELLDGGTRNGHLGKVGLVPGCLHLARLAFLGSGATGQ